jgi:hypothetical protein
MEFYAFFCGVVQGRLDETMERKHWRAFPGLLSLRGPPNGDLAVMFGAKDETDPSVAHNPSVAAMNSQNELFQEKQITLAFSSIFIAVLCVCGAHLEICMVQRAVLWPPPEVQ